MVASVLQTLDRGLAALTIVSESVEGISTAALSARLDVHRAIAHRLVATLEAHRLVTRGPDGLLRLGAGLMELASRYEPQLRLRAEPLLRALADQAQAAAFLVVAQGEECVAIMVAEPPGGVLRISYRVGSRHPLSIGAAGIAILAGRPPSESDPDIVKAARRDGYSITRGELQKGAVGVASPIRGMPASIGLVALDDLDLDRTRAAVVACVAQLSLAGTG